MTHILLDITYKNIEPVLYDKNRGESIIKSWCEYNNHSLVMPPITHVFPTFNERQEENIIEGFFHSSLSNCVYDNYKCHDDSSSSIRRAAGVESERRNYSGYTSIGLLKESHISFHTYPEHNSIQIDFFSCKDLNKRQNTEYIERVFKVAGATKFNCQFIKRQVI